MTDISEVKRCFSNAPWEERIGYCRALRIGNFVSVTGTAPLDQDGNVFQPGKPYEQTKRCLEIIKKSLENLDVQMSAIVRTRMFVTDISMWEQYGRAHKEVFSNHPPTTTMVEVKSLIDPGMLIEIEADAYVP